MRVGQGYADDVVESSWSVWSSILGSNEQEEASVDNREPMDINNEATPIVEDVIPAKEDLKVVIEIDTAGEWDGVLASSMAMLGYN